MTERGHARSHSAGKWQSERLREWWGDESQPRVQTQWQMQTLEITSRWTNRSVFPLPLLSFQGYGMASKWHVRVWYVDLHISHQKAFNVFCKAISFSPKGLLIKLYRIPTIYGCWDIIRILLIACRYSWVTCFPLELAMWSCISAIFYGQMNNDQIQHGFSTQMGPIIDSSHAANTC